MARHETVYSVFVASPNDVEDERNSLEGVIRELNLVWSRELGMRLELIKWETHSIPGINVDPQSVINETVPLDYDIFIGVMWHRFGSPTGRAGSGTVEEFEFARSRLQTEQPPKILFYFRSSSPSSLAEIDASQLKAVNDFKQKIGNEGTYYWQYRDPAEFSTIVRVHLSGVVQKIQRENQKTNDNLNSCKHEVFPPDLYLEENEKGLFDYIDIFEENITKSKISLENITRETNVYATRINQSASDLNKVSTKPPHLQSSKSEARRIISRTAGDMIFLAERISTEIPVYRESFRAAIDAFTSVLELQSDFVRNSENENAIAEALSSIDELYRSLETVTFSISSFRQKVSETPRMSGELNRAKRAIVVSTDKLMAELETSANLLSSARQFGRRLGY